MINLYKIKYFESDPFDLEVKRSLITTELGEALKTLNHGKGFRQSRVISISKVRINEMRLDWEQLSEDAVLVLKDV